MVGLPFADTKHGRPTLLIKCQGFEIESETIVALLKGTIVGAVCVYQAAKVLRVSQLAVDPKNVANLSGFAFALHVQSPEIAEKYFSALSQSGEIQMPLAETFFAYRYGIVRDPFGVSWKIIAANKE